MSEPLGRSQHSQLLEELAESLDIPPGKYRQAVERYQAVGQWLAAPESSLHPFAPTIHPQGSFRLGTVIRPVRHHKDADYDYLVCELAIRPERIGPGELKNLVGDRLKTHATYRRLLSAAVTPVRASDDPAKPNRPKLR